MAFVYGLTQANEHREIWLVDETGRNVGWCIQDVSKQVPIAIEWFNRLGDISEVLRILLEESQEMPELWGFGNNPSPVRLYLQGYVAFHLGDQMLARERLQHAVSSSCFSHLFSTVEGALNRAQLIMACSLGCYRGAAEA